jgi:heme exporter protein B
VTPRLAPILAAAFMRELLCAWRRPGDALAPLVFFVIVGTLFPLGSGAEPALLRAVGPGVLWTAALLAALLGIGRMYAADHASGALEQLLLTPAPLGLLVGARVAAQWAVGALPLIVIAPGLALSFRLEWVQLPALLGGLLLGTPVLYLLGSISAALTLAARAGGVLLGLLVLPLAVPVLVFGAGAVHAAGRGLDASPSLALLGALLVLATVFAPWAAGAALRIALD